jgi:hypothetical protein
MTANKSFSEMIDDNTAANCFHLSDKASSMLFRPKGNVAYLVGPHLYRDEVVDALEAIAMKWLSSTDSSCICLGGHPNADIDNRTKFAHKCVAQLARHDIVVSEFVMFAVVDVVELINVRRFGVEIIPKLPEPDYKVVTKLIVYALTALKLGPDNLRQDYCL